MAGARQVWNEPGIPSGTEHEEMPTKNEGGCQKGHGANVKGLSVTKSEIIWASK